MARIYFVRHGKAAAGWDGHPDPGLDPLGLTQAHLAADVLAPLGPMQLLSSPLARARETAQPLAELWDVEPTIETRVAEIPSPTADLAERAVWLREAMSGHWSELDAPYRAWRDTVVACLSELEVDTVIFSHFIAINAAVGHATGDDRLVSFRPDNGSITQLEVTAGKLELLRRGDEADTKIN